MKKLSVWNMQRDESRVEQALSGLHQAAHTLPQLQQSLMQAAEAVDRVRYQQAEDLDQLRDRMVRPPGVAVSHCCGWATWARQLHKLDFLQVGMFLDVPSIAAVTKTARGLTHCLPFVVVPSFDSKVFEDSSSRAGAVWWDSCLRNVWRAIRTIYVWRRWSLSGVCRFSEGPLAGLRIPLATIYRACSSYTGEPCNLLDPDDFPPSLKPLHRIMNTQRKGIIHVYLKVRRLQSQMVWPGLQHAGFDLGLILAVLCRWAK